MINSGIRRETEKLLIKFFKQIKKYFRWTLYSKLIKNPNVTSSEDSSMILMKPKIVLDKNQRLMDRNISEQSHIWRLKLKMNQSRFF